MGEITAPWGTPLFGKISPDAVDTPLPIHCSTRCPIATRARQQSAHLHDVAVQFDQARRSAQQAAFAARMQTYLASGDPILMREAIAWMQARSPSPHP
ncbi:hypothetical protein [Leptolyngbya sp. O-77]|uniref:hypothetical protein n=1 Tax=Leptolyngbya sp. O-77 TaxID=1080068 RepID=UPI00155F6BD7|nr:hypothetical protein [Leptolyngbya sp. O-77]